MEVLQEEHHSIIINGICSQNNAPCSVGNEEENKARIAMRRLACGVRCPRQESGNEATTSLLGNDGSCSYAAPSLVSPQWLSRFPFDSDKEGVQVDVGARQNWYDSASQWYSCQFRSVRTYNDSREDIAFVFHTTVVEPNPQSRCQWRGTEGGRVVLPCRQQQLYIALLFCANVLGVTHW